MTAPAGVGEVPMTYDAMHAGMPPQPPAPLQDVEPLGLVVPAAGVLV